MSQIEKERFAAVMKSLAVNAGVELTPDVLKFYRMTLKNFSMDQIEDAAQKVLLTWKYGRMPPLALLVEAINGGSSETVKVEDRALVIANQIIAHLNREGARIFPDLNGDPIAQHLMITRWPYYTWARNVIASELKWWVKEFCDEYRVLDEFGNIPLQQIEAQEQIKPLLENIGTKINKKPKGDFFYGNTDKTDFGKSGDYDRKTPAGLSGQDR